MKINHFLLLALLPVLIQAQSNQNTLLGTWIFESMTTITKAQREEITIVYKDKKMWKPCPFMNQELLNTM